MSMLEGEASARQPKPVPNTPSNVLAQFSLSSRVVAINGAAAGIGFAVAEAMAEAGADVALFYNSNDAAIAKAKELAEQHKIKARAYQVQVTDHVRVEQAISEVVKDFGKLDVFVANAGMAISKPVLETSVEEYKKQTAVNCKFYRFRRLQSFIDKLLDDGIFYCAKYAGHVFKKQGFGTNYMISFDWTHWH